MLFAMLTLWLGALPAPEGDLVVDSDENYYGCFFAQDAMGGLSSASSVGRSPSPSTASTIGCSAL